MSHLFHAYEMTVTKVREPDQLRLLGNFDDHGAGLLAVLQDFLTDPGNKDWLDQAVAAAARIETVHGPTADQPAVIDAIVQSGETGVYSDLIDTANNQLGTNVSFTREGSHAEMVPVLILAKLPGAQTKGILLSHSPSGRGIKTKFWGRFKEWFTARYPDYRVHVQPIFPEGFYRELLEERALTKVTLVKYVRPKDVTDAENPWFPPKDLGTITTVLAPRRRYALRKPPDLLRALDDDKARAGLLTFRNEQYDEIKATVTGAEGRQHTINLAGSLGGRPGYDVTDRLRYGVDGHPTYDSVREAALEYLEVLTGG